jgi:hypothetical protein
MSDLTVFCLPCQRTDSQVFVCQCLAELGIQIERQFVQVRVQDTQI